MQSSLLFYAMFIHIAWVACLYGLLTLARAPVVWNINASARHDPRWKSIENRISANLSNQFEWPLFFHVLCALLISTQSIVNPAYVWLSCVFVFGRLVHSGVQILSGNIRLRGLVFTINFIAVLIMWGLFAISI